MAWTGENYGSADHGHQHHMLQPARHARPNAITRYPIPAPPPQPLPAFEAASKLCYLVTPYLISRKYMVTAVTLCLALNSLSASDDPTTNGWTHFSAVFLSGILICLISLRSAESHSNYDDDRDSQWHGSYLPLASLYEEASYSAVLLLIAVTLLLLTHQYAHRSISGWNLWNCWYSTIFDRWKQQFRNVWFRQTVLTTPMAVVGVPVEYDPWFR